MPSSVVRYGSLVVGAVCVVAGVALLAGLGAALIVAGVLFFAGEWLFG